ncbi:gliding motility-associated C-terminal domain-containing protein [Lacinutrix iliipiscaria]|uniref:Gliding motility-associated C-terminal domain-containing protein n=1 Tax=Lacinutrix iliipiscaria TaxID=1230532 RepID=A0ABW5WKG6_9FLAO
MKKITLSLLFGFMSLVGFSQVGLVENFDGGLVLPAGWTSDPGDYFGAVVQVCDGFSQRVNLDLNNDTAHLTSPNIVGQSNGTDLTIAFDYKVVDWSEAIDATAPGWGQMTIQYSTNDGGVWIDVEVIDDDNHVTSDTCANWTTIVPAASLPIGSDFKLRIDAEWEAGSYYIYLDNISATQVVVGPPSCVNLIAPTDGSTGVSINSDLEWSAATNIPTGYTVVVGTTSGGTDIADNVNAGLSTTYDLPTLEYSTTYYVSVIPFNANGPAIDCPEWSFTTGADPNAPVDCAAGTPINTVYCYDNNDTMTWNFQSSDGSPLNIFFNAGQFETCCDDITIYDGIDDTGTILFSDGLADMTGVSHIALSGFLYVELNSDVSQSCASNAFIPLDFDVSCVDTTALPNCNAALISPANGALDVGVNEDLTWSPASILVTGYFVSIGTTPGGTDVADNVDVGLATTYDPGTLDYETDYYVTITPYNDNGSAINCNEESFTTRDDPNQIVDCSINEVINTVFCYENGDNTFLELFNFQSSDGSPLSIVFNSGYLEDCCDFIQILDSDGSTIFLSDTTLGNDLTGLSFITTGDSLTILLDADTSVSCGSTGNAPWDFDVSCVDTTQLPNCNAVLTAPLDGDIGINENDDINWSPATILVTGYFVSIGTTPGGTDIADNVDVGNVTTYDPGTLDYETTYYVTITPYNDNGSATGCIEESFTTRPDPNQIVDCSINEVINTVFCYENGDNTFIELFNFQSSDGSPLSIFFNSGYLEDCCDFIQILDSDGSTIFLSDTTLDNDLTGLSFVTTGDSLTILLDADTSVSCGSTGNAPWDFDVSCVDTTAIPNCNASLTSPLDGAIDINENDDLNWTPASVIVTGYFVSIGTTPGGTDVADNVDVGNVLTYDPGTLDYETTYYVTITPYNDNGPATGCIEESFTTRPDPNVIVDCDSGEVVNTTYCYENGVNDVFVEIFNFQSSNGYPLNILFNSGEIEDFWDSIQILDADGSLIYEGDNGGDLTGLSFTTTGDSLTILIESDGVGSCQTSGYIPWDFDVWCSSCLPQTVSYNTIGDCETDPDNPEFVVEVDITDLGDATSLTITDDQGSAPQTTTTTGVIVFGPYAANTVVVVTTENTDDANCVNVSSGLTFICPPPPNPCSIIYAGEDATVDCDDTATDLTANFHLFGQDTSTYIINGLETCPTPVTVGGTPTSLNIDDTWSEVLEIGFEFCFFGDVYSQILVGSNGVLSFEIGNAGGFNDWGFNDPLPNNTDDALAQGQIFGVGHDIDPSVCGDINYLVVGSAPYRQFVVNYTNVCHFSCNELMSSSQIILYESSNNIDINVFDKPTCPGWNNGNAVIGVQNVAGTEAFTAPGRNTGSWSITEPESWRFAPSEGTPLYTFEWFDGATSLGNTETITVEPTVTTTYTASVTYELCTGGTATITDDVVVEVLGDGSDDASFTLTPTCDGATATITGTPGGTFDFDPAPADAATIDPDTGTITGGTPGETYSVQYVVSASSTCPAASTETVTVLPEDDSSFTVSPACDGGTATVTGVPGGTFAFNPVPADGAVIDPDTGTVTGGTPGASYTIEYTTNGTCPSTSTQTLNTLLDGGAFVEDFGTGTDREPTPYTTYTFNGVTQVDDGEYAINNNASDLNTGWHDMEDHTVGDTDGLMFVVNASAVSGEFYRRSIFVTENTEYNFSAWITTVYDTDTFICPGTGVPSNVTFRIEDASGTLISDVNTGDIQNEANPNWQEFQLTFNTLTNTEVQLVLLNQGASGCGNDLAIDDISLTPVEPVLTFTADCDGGTISVMGAAGGTFALNPVPTDGAVIDSSTGTITGGTAGAMYTVEYTLLGGCLTTSLDVTLLLEDDASFTMTATCDGGTATITGDTGGTFAFNPVPTDGAMIDSSTGTVTAGTAGTTYTVEYTTGGTCSATSTQTVTALPEDDASFTMTATCDGGTATITGDSGGTFTFNPVPTDGAMIDSTTGTVTAGTAGTTYTVDYTTAGTCPTTSSQTVTVLPEDDASFTMTANCDGGTATVTGDAGGTFAFNPVPTDGAVIDSSTGTITGGIPGTTYTVEYTSAGTCTSSSTQMITILTSVFDFTVVGDCNGAIFELTVNPTGNSYDPNTATYVLYDDMNSVLQTNTIGDNVFVISPSIFTPPMAGSSYNYVVEVTSAEGCVETNTVLVNSINCLIPQAISPNNDSYNDNFDLSGYNVSRLEIFNRHGIKVYSKTNYTNEWYGQTDDGKELPVGTYFYVMEYQGNKTKSSWVYINK